MDKSENVNALVGLPSVEDWGPEDSALGGKGGAVDMI